MNIDPAPIYNYLKTCDIEFFSTLSAADMKVCDAIADYFAEKPVVLENKDLSEIKVQIDKYRRRELPPGEISKAVTDLYARFHAAGRATIAAVPKDVMRKHILADVAVQMSEVSKDWSQLSRDDKVWEAIAKKIGFSVQGANPGTVHKVVMDHCRRFIKTCLSFPEMTPDISAQLVGPKGEMSLTVEKMLMLIEWRKARDTLVVWKKIDRVIRPDSQFLPFREGENAIETAKGFGAWIAKNENRLRYPALFSLNLANCHLTSLPPEIGRLTDLRQLILDKNELGTLPDEIGNLSHLNKLSVVINRLTSIPKTIGNLQSLTRLSLSFNHLTTLPAEICKLQNLEHIEIFENRHLVLTPEVETFIRSFNT